MAYRPEASAHAQEAGEQPLRSSHEEILQQRAPAKTQEEFNRVATVARQFGLEGKLDEFLQPGEKRFYDTYIQTRVAEMTGARLKQQQADLKKQEEELTKIRATIGAPPPPRLGVGVKGQRLEAPPAPAKELMTQTITDAPEQIFTASDGRRYRLDRGGDYVPIEDEAPATFDTPRGPAEYSPPGERTVVMQRPPERQNPTDFARPDERTMVMQTPPAPAKKPGLLGKIRSWFG